MKDYHGGLLIVLGGMGSIPMALKRYYMLSTSLAPKTINAFTKIFL